MARQYSRARDIASFVPHILLPFLDLAGACSHLLHSGSTSVLSFDSLTLGQYISSSCWMLAVTVADGGGMHSVQKLHPTYHPENHGLNQSLAALLQMWR